jgi:hypothetical protein
MPTKITPEVLQRTLYNLDLSSNDKRFHVNELVSQLKKSSAGSESFQSSNTKIREKVKRRIQGSPFLTELTKESQIEKLEFEVLKRENVWNSLPIDTLSTFPKLFPKPDLTMGPFPTVNGNDVYFDFIRYMEVGSIKLSNQIEPILYISAKVRKNLLGQTSILEINLPKGSIWINANYLNPDFPDSTFIGVKIKSGKIKFRTAVSPVNGEIVLNVLNPFSIELELDNEFEIGNDDEYGWDARNAKVSLPTELNFSFSLGKLKLGRVEDLNAEVYGDSKTFQCETNFLFDPKDNLGFLTLIATEIPFRIVNSQSKFHQIEGRSRIKKSAWYFTTRKIQNGQTIPVEINGYISLDLESGLSCVWKGLEGSERVNLLKPNFKIIPGYLMIFDDKASYERISETLFLWQKMGETGEAYDMEAQLDFSSYKSFIFLSDSKGIEMVSAKTDVDLFIDKPLQADGDVLSPQISDVIYVKSAQKDNSIVQLLGLEKDPIGVVQEHQFVIENAFFTTGPLGNFFLRGLYDSENALKSGSLIMEFDLIRLIPSLPHPYTGRLRYHEKYAYDIYSNQYDGNLSVFGELFAICTWDDNQDFRKVNVDFKLNQQLLHPHSIKSEDEDSSGINRKLKGLEEEVNRRNQEMFTLFDVSTKEDHLGISMSFSNIRAVIAGESQVTINGENTVTIERMNLRAPMTLLNGMTLPHITWEPFINETVPSNPDDPKAGYLELSNNSFPTVFYQTDNQFINIHPRDYIHKFQNNLKPKVGEITNINDQNEGKIFFSLPNGKLSLAQLTQFDSNKQTMNKRHLDFIQPKFKFNSNQLRGGIQYRISAFSPVSPSAPPTLKGMTTQLRNILNDAGKSVLSETVHQIFENVFNVGPSNVLGVPVTHLDFSGYGASTYSDWKRPKAKYASIAQAKFDIMRGRLGHEIVQAVSMIYPYGICATRTISFYRRNNSIIYREDSGWVAQSDGLMNFDVVNETTGLNLPSQMNFHPGLFKGVYDVENIKEISKDYIEIDYPLIAGDYYKPNPLEVIPFPGGNKMEKAKFIGVTFDSDALVEHAEGFENFKVTGKKFKGYLQIMPEGVPVPPRILDEILKRCNDSLGGNVDCEVNIANSGQRLKANRVDITRSFEGNNTFNPVFIGTVRGSVRLPDEGSWSMVEVDKSGNVGNLSDDKNISVIREGLRNKNLMEMQIVNEAAEAKIAFPDALLNEDIQKTYGILQNTETQKILFRDPFLKKNEIGKLFTTYKSCLADSFRLLDSKGPFPNLENAIELANDNAILDVLPNSAGIKKIINYTVPNNFDFDILGKEGDPFRIYVNYKSKDSDNTVISYVTDSLSGGDKWKNEMDNLSVLVDLSIFKPLLTITGDFQSGISVKPSLEKGNTPQLKFAKELETIYQILEFLDELSMDKPVEAIKKGLKIAMSNSSDSWEYKFKAGKEISLVRFPFDPVNYNSPTTPLKMEAFFRVGCYFNQPIVIPKTINQIKPSAGAYMELGAELRVMCVSLAAATIYAVGKAEIGLAADLNNPPSLYFKFGFGVELSVGLPVIGSVSVMYMVGIDIKINNDVMVGAFIYFRGRVEIFAGIVTITIAIEAKGSIQKIANGPTNCEASCTFALDISIAFVINLNFSETWKETRQIS